MTSRHRRFRWITHDGRQLFDLGILADGSLHNPNGYPEQLVRDAVAGAVERRHQRRSAGAKRGAKTRARRQQLLINEVADKIRQRQNIGPLPSCYICGRKLDDPDSVARGIGPECWGQVLAHFERFSQQFEPERWQEAVNSLDCTATSKPHNTHDTESR